MAIRSILLSKSFLHRVCVCVCVPLFPMSPMSQHWSILTYASCSLQHTSNLVRCATLTTSARTICANNLALCRLCISRETSPQAISSVPSCRTRCVYVLTRELLPTLLVVMSHHYTSYLLYGLWFIYMGKTCESTRRSLYRGV